MPDILFPLLAQRKLYNKASKVYHKLCKDILSLNPNIKNCLHVFDHTIKPILLFGSEIWGCFNPFKKVLKRDDISFDKIYPNLFADKLHIKFCKKKLKILLFC